MNAVLVFLLFSVIIISVALLIRWGVQYTKYVLYERMRQQYAATHADSSSDSDQSTEEDEDSLVDDSGEPIQKRRHHKTRARRRRKQHRN